MDIPFESGSFSEVLVRFVVGAKEGGGCGFSSNFGLEGGETKFKGCSSTGLVVFAKGEIIILDCSFLSSACLNGDVDVKGVGENCFSIKFFSIFTGLGVDETTF